MMDANEKSEKYAGSKTTAAKTDQGYATAITVCNTTFANEQESTYIRSYGTGTSVAYRYPRRPV